MSFSKRSVFFCLMILSSLVMLVLSDLLLGVLGINREYRLTHPDRIHRNDIDLLFIERANLNLAVPIFPTLVPANPGKLKPSLIWTILTNGRGMNEAEFSVKKLPGTLRIVALGDSCTFGWAVDREQGYVRVMERELRKRTSRPLEVLNAGHSAFSTFQGLILLDRIVRDWQPDFITVCFGFNDRAIASRNTPDKVVWERQHSWLGTIRFNLERSNWFLIGLRAFQKASHSDKPPAPGGPGHRVSQEDFGENIAGMAHLCSELGASLIIITQQFQPWDDLTEAYYRKLLEIAVALSLPVVDCAAVFRNLQKKYGITTESPNRLYIDNGIHPQPEGHEIIGAMVANQLAGMLEQRE